MAKVENSKFFAANRIGRIGHFHQPHGSVAATASIPSKYRTIVITNDEKKGFNCGTKRFEWQESNEGPGPAKYSPSNSLGRENNVSFSKKGLGGFASKVKRFPIKMNPDCFVGPGEYNAKIKNSHDFNRANCTGNFHKPIANKDEAKSFHTPAPNTYNLSDHVIGRLKPDANAVVHPPFMSRTNRELLTPKLSNPAPNAYDICNIENPRAAQAPFKSTTKRMSLAKSTLSNPGPGSYNPYDTENVVTKRGLPRKHYLCVAAPAMQMPPAEPPPGPGQYDIVDYKGPRKQYISSSMFVSTTNRWGPVMRPNSNPGPATYNPKRIPTSFIYNVDDKWL